MKNLRFVVVYCCFAMVALITASCEKEAVKYGRYKCPLGSDIYTCISNHHCINTYNENFITFTELKKKFGDKMSDMKYMNGLYGQPLTIVTDCAKYGIFDVVGIRDSISDKISDMPFCVTKTYGWFVDSSQVLIVHYRTRQSNKPTADWRIRDSIIRDTDLIPIWGYLYNPALVD